MLSSLSKLLAKLSDWLVRIAAVVVFVLMAILVGETILRYVFNAPLIFSDELSAYCITVITFLSLASAFVRGAHIRATLITDRFSKPISFRIRGVTLSLGLVFAAVFTWRVAILIIKNYIDGYRTLILSLPIWALQIVMFIGLIVLTLMLLLYVLRHYLYGEKAESENVSIYQ